MRYLNIDTAEFTDETGKVIAVKDLRPIEELTTVRTIKVERGDMLDQIANRTDVFGRNSEAQIYKLFDHNIVALKESGFDLDKIRELKVPL